MFPPPSAIYRYSNDIHHAVEESELYTLLDNMTKNSLPEYSEGQYIEGRFTHIKTMNKLFHNYSYGSLRSALSNHMENKIIHYSSPMIPLKLNPKTKVVTFHDPPSILQNSEMFSIESEISSFKNGMRTKFQSRYYKYFRTYENVLTVSNYVRTLLINEGFNENTKVIYPCISTTFKFLEDKQSIKNKLGLPGDKVCILSVSTSLKRKNLKMVKKTMELLGEKFKLVRVGSPVMSDEITFTNINNELMNQIYNACDVMLFPSLYEGFGYPLVEAFATGLPVVASDIEVFRETSGGDSAILTNPSDPSSLVKAVKDALDTSEELAKKGVRRAELFSFKRFSKEINEYYRAILT